MGFAFQQAHSQSYTQISGSDLNLYTAITEIQSSDDANSDTLVVADATGFGVGDTVMVYCVKGATIGTGDPTYQPGDHNYPPGDDAADPLNTGRYGFYLISEVIGNSLVLNARLYGFIRNMEEGEVAQLIRARSYRYATVTSAGLSAPDWNPVSGTGGVLTLFVHGVLRLDGDIDVSSAGFKGAPGGSDVLYPNGCSSTDTMDYYENFYLDGELWAGLKGEGITNTSFLYTRGKASNINGGGGGNGLHAGGGGGSNHGFGVRGGAESSDCLPGVLETGGDGGFDLGTGYYINGPDALERDDRIFFGGGGGSGTRTSLTISTNGGHGGGIVVIIADTIDGNGHWIRADGGDVSGIALNGAGAGGGGAGCIILDVAGYQGTLNLSSVGGDGGNSSGSDTTGMGGAGGGGVYWLAGDTHPGVAPVNATGTNGAFLSPIPYTPLLAPSFPDEVFDLVAPLKGFLFNPVPSEIWVCSDQDPDPIITSDPKGGEAPYTYQWVDSSSTQNFWADIPGATARDYDPGLLSDTIYYKRILTSDNSLVDTSFRIAVYVHPAITGNAIAANDTVCSGNAPELFVSSATIGGRPTGGSYEYVWQHEPEGAGGYTDLTIKTTEPTYQEGDLTISTDYRRLTYSGVCIDTSNVERVRVLETLTGNDITPYDTICINTIPDLIDGPAPTDGDQDDLRYQWLTSDAPGVMGTLIPGETALSYQSPALSQTTYIRRIVLSGNDDACRDTSAFVEILNIPVITGNIILDSHTLCQEDQADLLNGSTPGGGYMSQYNYTWISSTDQSSWVPATGGGPNDVRTGFDPGVMSGDTTWYRRVVGSGGLELVCKDTSDFIVINVLPSITNNVVTPADLLQCQLEMPEALSGSLPGGGATVGGNDPTRVYRWEVAQIEGIPGSGNWNHPSTGADAQNFTDPNQLTTDVDRWYKRIVISGPGGECTDTSNLVRLVVHSQITANAIDANQAICFNEDDPVALRNLTLTGGEDTIVPVYTWRRWLEGESSADATNIANSDDLEYVSGPYTDPATLIYNYDRMVEIGACRDTSNEMLVTVMQLPSGQLTDADFAACEKETFLNLDLNMSSLTAGHYAPLWEVYLEDGVNPGRIGPGSVDQDLDTMGIILDTYGADHVTYTYEIESIRYYPEGDDYACVSSVLPPSSVVVDLSRRPAPEILADGEARESFKVCNDSALLVLNPDNGTLTSWSDPTGSVSITSGSGQNEFHVSIPDNSGDYGQYRIYAKSEAGDCAGLDSIELYFFEQPAPAYAGTDTMLFLINSVKLKADPPTAGIGTWHLTNGSGSFDDEHDPNATVSGLEMGVENTFRWTIENGEDEGLCSTSQDVTIVHRNEVKSYNGFSPNGDMDNEYFIMQGLAYADEFEVIFLNSLGNEVRTINQDNYSGLEEHIDESLITGGLRDDELVIWDGRSNNGNMVPAGTYYFVATLTMYMRDQSEAITGSYDYEFPDYVVVERD